MSTIIVCDPAYPQKAIPNGYLFMYKDNTKYSSTYPKTVGGLLTQMRTRWKDKKLEKEMFIIDVWGGWIGEKSDTQGSTFTIGRYNRGIDANNVTEKLSERKVFYRNKNFIGLCTVNVGYNIEIGKKQYFGSARFSFLKHKYCNSNLDGLNFYDHIPLILPDFGYKIKFGNIQYMNPWGMWEFYPAFVIGKQWRRRKADRPLELLERVTSESDELVLTVGIPTIALSRNPNNHRDARYVAEMLRSYVVYWAFNNNANQWVRVAVLNKEAKVDFHKAYFTVQLVLIRDFIYEDNRVIYNQENGTA